MQSSPCNRPGVVVCLISLVTVLSVSASQRALHAAVLAGNTITVNSTLDVASGSDGLCTLREAITAANSNTASGATAGECGAGSASDSDTISLTGVTGTITLASALPDITSDMTISGPGPNQLTISGNNAVRVFSVTLQSPGTVNFSGLTVTNGRIQDVGGGIYNQGSADVKVTNTRISNNAAVLGGGIANSSTGTFTVTNSTISSNTANTAAGCYNGLGTLNIISSTLNNNVAGTVAGIGNGGAINTGSNTLNIINSTIHNNTSFGGGGGIYNNSPDAIINITSSTITQNIAVANGGGGINNVNATQIKLRNTIIADNNSPSGPDLFGPFVSLGHNLLTNTAGNTGFTPGTNNPNGDLAGLLVVPRLGPLQDNGGSTSTRALLPGSPAIDAGDNCVVLASGSGGCLTTPLTTDQRGVSRMVNSTVDIGAFESRAFAFGATSGTPQSAAVNTAFAPLVVTVSSASGDPVAGGFVTFTAPATGPTASLGPTNTLEVFINSSGQASTTPTANGLAGGPYNVTVTINRAPGSATFTLTNNKAATNTTVTSSSNPSDLTQSVTFTATVTSTGPLTGTVQFKIDGSNAGSALTLSNGVATFTTSTLTVGTHSVTADYSGDANFLSSSGTLTGGQVVKPPPSLSIGDLNFSEGDAGTKVISFAVTLSTFSNLSVTADFATANNTASAPSDYVATSGTLTFSPGQILRFVAVTINGDTVFEPDETFTVNLSNPVNATINKVQATGTIENDEAPVLLTEQNTSRAVALDLVNQTRHPFTLTNPHNLSADQRRRVSLFVWRLGLLPGDTTSNVTILAEDEFGTDYQLVIEHVAPVAGLDDVNQVIVRLPDQLVGTPENLFLRIRVRGPFSNTAIISFPWP
jgi:CSLREA domain-containing protein